MTKPKKRSAKSLTAKIARKQKMIDEYERLAKECDREETRQYFRKRANDFRRDKDLLEAERREIR
jgi:hypothetical protein